MGLTLVSAVLTGLLFGALAASLRRYILPIVSFPLLAAPVGYFLFWRDAIVWDCLYAARFGTLACTPTRELAEQTIIGLPMATMFAVVHMATGVALVIALMIVRRSIDFAFMERPAASELDASQTPDELETREAPKAEASKANGEMLAEQDTLSPAPA